MKYRHSKGLSWIDRVYSSGMHAAEVLAMLEQKMRSTECTSQRASTYIPANMTVTDKVTARAVAWLLVDSAAKQTGKDPSGTTGHRNSMGRMLNSQQCTSFFIMPPELQKTVLPLETYSLEQGFLNDLQNATLSCIQLWQTLAKALSPVSIKCKLSFTYCK